MFKTLPCRLAAYQESSAATQRQLQEENEELQNQLLIEHKELAELRERSVMEREFLEYELSKCREEYAACHARLEKTHDALGISAEKAKRLETSHGRLQLDLNGTLSTLEEANQRHEQQHAQWVAQQRKLEAGLRQALADARGEGERLRQELEASKAREQACQERLTASTVAADAEKLALRHSIERLTERLEAAEGGSLDPAVLSNVMFAPSVSGAVRRKAAVSLAIAPSGVASVSLAPPRGRLQNMVPPTWRDRASPAPR